MTKGDKRRSRRKYRVRYDRIVILVLIIAAIAVLITSCVKWAKHEPKPDKVKDPKPGASVTTTTGSPAGSEPDSETTTAAAPENTTLSGYQLISVDKNDMYKGDLVLVNAKYEYKFPAGDVDPIPVWQNQNDFYGYGDMNTSLDSRVLHQLNSMIEAYANENWLSVTDIFVLDGYRTYEDQVERHASGRSKTFEAGHTDYHTGRTIDFFRFTNNEGSAYAYFSAEGTCEWFAENAGKFGFIVRYPIGKDEQTGEKGRTYTYRFVGTPHAQYINENGLCLEEYIDLLKGHTNSDPLTMSCNGHSYSVYYVPAGSEDKVDVPVPTDKQYVISGNNADGFIVTAILS